MNKENYIKALTESNWDDVENDIRFLISSEASSDCAVFICENGMITTDKEENSLTLSDSIDEFLKAVRIEFDNYTNHFDFSNLDETETMFIIEKLILLA
jgi:hypothetical protein